MKLTSMKMTAADLKKRSETCCTPMDKDAPAYPWGLSITLEEDALAKLGLESLPKTESGMMLTARVEVSAVSSTATAGGGERRSVSLQITALALAPESKGSELYDKGDE